jgi:hypothetical protein
VISYRATLDVPRSTAARLAAWLGEHRRVIGTRRGRRALSCSAQAVLVLRWFRDRSDVAALARDAGVAACTAYRYLHEGITVLAARAPDLHHALTAARERELPFVLLDGTLIGTDRVAARTEAGNDAWYSGKHRHHGGNVQILADPTGFPIWVSDVRPGATHDLTAARELALPALYPHAVRGLPVLTDKGYTGAGIGIRVPVRNPSHGQVLDPDTRTRNTLLTGLRALGERANALLKTRWRALRHVTLDPIRIGDIARAALVLTTLERGRY